MSEAQKPPVDMAAIMASPDVQAAITKAAAEAATAAVTEFAKSAVAPPPSVGDAGQLFSQMALAIAEISDQGTSRKRVAPEVLARREAAAKRCHELIMKARASDLKPEYRVVSKIYFNERLIEPYRRQSDKSVVPQEIIWTGVPNDALRPANEIAHEIFAAFRESVGGAVELKPISGPNGGQAAMDTRPLWMTPGGLVVKGDAPPKAWVAPAIDFDSSLEFKDNNDPNAAEVHVLGTIAAPAKRNQADRQPTKVA